MKNRHEKHLDDLAIIAEDAQGAARAHLAASIVLNNKIISIGVNSYKSHPFQKRYGKNSEAIYIHSEISAINRALKRISVNDLANSTLYVARVKKKSKHSKHFDSWGLAKPCEGCMRAIAAFNIKKVYYTTDENTKYECL